MASTEYESMIDNTYTGEDRRHDRRSDSNMELQKSVLKILSKVESLEANIETKLDAHSAITQVKLESVFDRISNLDEKLTNSIDDKANKIKDIELKVKNHCDLDSNIETALNVHEKAIEEVGSYCDRIVKLENKYINLKDRVILLEDEDKNKNDKFVKDIKHIVYKSLLGIIGVGSSGFIGFIIVQYIRSIPI